MQRDHKTGDLMLAFEKAIAGRNACVTSTAFDTAEPSPAPRAPYTRQVPISILWRLMFEAVLVGIIMH